MPPGPRQAVRPLLSPLVLAVAALLPAQRCAAAAAAKPVDLSDLTPGQLQTPQQVELFLEVSIDGQPTGQLAPFTQGAAGAHGLRTPVQTLRDLGLDPILFGVVKLETFDLDDIRGLRYTYDAARQRIDLQVGDTLRHPTALGVRASRPMAPADNGRGFLLNYNVHAETAGSRAVSATTELRYFDNIGVLSNTGAAVLNGDQRGYVRYDTTWTRSNAEDLSTLEIGDVISPALGWTRAMRLGGIQWRRNFALRPDLLTYPVTTYGASAVVPSSVSLFVDGVRQFQSNVASGPYQVRDIGGVNGAGQATIVTEDALGRVTSATLPLYVDTRLLEAGLTDYAAALGAPRRDYGLHSFAYGPGAILAVSARHGWSNTLTVEGHAEATRGLANAGAGVLVRLGQVGVVSAAIAGSAAGAGSALTSVTATGADGVVTNTVTRERTAAARGGYTSLGYQYIARGYSIDVLSERTTRGFADAGTSQGSPYVRVSDRINLNVALGRGQSAGLGFINYKLPQQQAARIVSLSVARPLAWGLHLSVSAYRDLRRTEARGVQATLSLAFGNRSAGSVTMGSQNGVSTRTLAASSAPDPAGGIGWSAQKGEFGGQAYDQVQLQYLGSAGQVGINSQSAGGSRSTSVDLTGSLVAMDGAVLPARHVGRGFALVATGMPGLPVLQENRPIGITDSGGRLLVPDLMPYTRNEISIDTASVPADVHVAAGSQSVVPRLSTGVVARFAFERYSAATVIVNGADGKPVAAGTAAHLEGGATSLVGYDGVTFVEGLKPENVLILGEGGGACRVRFSYTPGAPGTLPTIGPLICQPQLSPK